MNILSIPLEAGKPSLAQLSHSKLCVFILNVLVPLVGGLLCSNQEDRSSDCSGFLPTVSSAGTGWTQRIKILHVEMQEEHMDKPAVETH